MQFDDPRSILESAAAKPTRDLVPAVILKHGARLRRIRYAFAAASTAAVVVGASAAMGAWTGEGNGAVRPEPAASSRCGDGEEQALLPELSEVRHRVQERVKELTRITDSISRHRDEPGSPARQVRAARKALADAEAELLELMERETEARRRAGSDGPDCRSEQAEVTTHEPAAQVVLLREECDSSLPGRGRARFPNGDLGTWCRFVLRVDNEGEMPIVLDPDLQELGSKLAVRRPWRVQGESGSLDAGLFEPIPPGESKLGEIVYLLREDEAPVALEIHVSGILRPIQFELAVTSCAADVAEEPQQKCLFEPGGPGYTIRGHVLEGPAEVELYHCGVMPIAFDKRSWIADPPPFDETNAPEGFGGRGRMTYELGSLSATYVDESGVSFEVRAVEDWEPPPCD
ncbi:MAG TPA: hypothetical protein VHI71_01545 [Actinomycetota bacterium]|nr:hypothetical protein [Actinomycetota bacterium]